MWFDIKYNTYLTDDEYKREKDRVYKKNFLRHCHNMFCQNCIDAIKSRCERCWTSGYWTKGKCEWCDDEDVDITEVRFD